MSAEQEIDMLGRSGDATMTGISSAQSGIFKIGGDIQINALVLAR
jgi:hypothetical protein